MQRVQRPQPPREDTAAGMHAVHGLPPPRSVRHVERRRELALGGNQAASDVSPALLGQEYPVHVPASDSEGHSGNLLRPCERLEAKRDLEDGNGSGGANSASW